MRLLLAPLLLVVPPCTAQAVTIGTERTGEIMLIDGAEPFTSISCGVFGPDRTRASQEDARRVTDTASTAARRTLSTTLRVPGARARPPAGGRARIAISESVLGADRVLTANAPPSGPANLILQRIASLQIHESCPLPEVVRQVSPGSSRTSFGLRGANNDARHQLPRPLPRAR